jgi:uncharacterized protein YukE
MSVNAAKANIVDATKQLLMRWDRLRDDWNDAASDRFQRDVIEQVQPRINQAIKAMDHAAEIMAHAKHECGDGE